MYSNNNDYDSEQNYNYHHTSVGDGVFTVLLISSIFVLLLAGLIYLIK